MTTKLNEHALLILYTGTGKGKSTAALGLAARVCGHGQKTCICQFIKAEPTGEYHFFSQCGQAEIHLLGKGFVFQTTPPEERKKHCDAALHGVELVRKKLISGSFALVIADEVLDAHSLGLISLQNLFELIESIPSGTTLIMTGRTAPPEVMELAHTVTEMKEVKHHFRQGIKSLKGIEF
ncbi:MAG: cob(I)yrinic acid a,c-diamide adenosyltransferase [Candidatus Auribacterota bacterium]